MNWEQYDKIVEEHGIESEESMEAYRDAVINDLKPLIETYYIDEFGDAIITCNSRTDFTTVEVLQWIKYQQNLSGAMAKIKGNKIKLEMY